jgi:DNA primase
MGVAHNLDELKNLIGPLAVYQDYVRLTARGRRRVGLCPFHKEKTPSFSVDEENGLFYCFGCHKGGDMIQFVQEMEGVGFKEALELLARKAGVDLEWRSPGGGQRDQAPDRKERLRKCLQSARDYYRGCLVAAPKGAPVKAYVDRRGIAPATEESLKLGFAPGQGGLLAYLKKAGFTAEEAQEAGLLLERGRGEWYERFRNRLIFPIVDLLGRTVGFGGRALGDEEPKYLNSPESPVFQKREVLYGLNWTKGSVREKEQLVLVEGYMDFMAVFQAGVGNAAATLGTALAEGQVRLVKRYAKEAVLNFDRDPAGVAAAKRAIQVLLGEGMRIRVISVPEGKDPDEFIRREGAEAYAGLVAGAKPFFEFLVDQSRGTLAKGGVEGKMAFLDEVTPYLTAVGDPIERQEYAKEVAGRAGLDMGLVLGRLAKAAAGDRAVHEAAASPRHDLPVAEQMLVKGLMEPAFRAKAAALVDGIPEEALARLESSDLVRALRRTGAAQGPEQMALLAYIQNGCHEALSEGNLESAVANLVESHLRDQERSLQQQIRDASRKGDLGLVQILNREKMAVLERIHALGQP